MESIENFLAWSRLLKIMVTDEMIKTVNHFTGKANSQTN